MQQLVVYCYKETPESKPNAEFFLKHAVVPGVKYIIIVNDCDSCTIAWPKDRPDFEVWARRHNSVDLTSFKDLLLSKTPTLFQAMDHIFFLNSSCRGPFMPVYVSQPWTQVLGDMLAPRGRHDLVAPIVEYPPNLLGAETEPAPFVHTYMFGVSRAGFGKLQEVLMSHPCITLDDNIVVERAIGQAFFKAGMPVKTLLARHRRVDLNDRKRWPLIRPSNACSDVEVPGNYYGIDVHAFELMFVKSYRKVSAHRRADVAGVSAAYAAQLQRYTEWA